MLEAIPNLYFWQDSVTGLIIEDGKVRGVETGMGAKFFSEAVILTSGTFMNGLIFVGRNQQSGGRMGDMASYGISEQLASIGFEVGRMKTGTPARFDGRTINFNKLAIQYGDENPSKFSFLPSIAPVQNQKPCYVINTSKKVHDILETGFEDSPLFTGTIKGIGPRYCPSIEDKIKTFSGKDSHQLFLEPEGRGTNEYYLSGFSSSLPLDVQLAALREVEGFENLEIFRPGYAIEYDYFPPIQLYHTLETKLVENLYFAGQVNGTTGYEEAGAQGLMAGVNAHLKLNKKGPFVLQRDQAYIGVLIDDLVTKGVDEPYRMFTSRAEYRILLRQDNADVRLTELSYNLGLASQERYDLMKNKKREVDALLEFIEKESIAPSVVDSYLENIGSAPFRQQRKLKELLLRPEVSIEAVAEIFPPLQNFLSSLSSPRAELIEETNILVNYSGYIERERMQADKLARLEKIKIPDNFNYSGLNITIEAQQKLSKIKPSTIGQASRIPGVSPADISVLLVSLGR